MALKNDLLLRAATGQPVERPPIWLMRQAGRFLTEYLEVRAKAGSFRNMISNPEFAAEVTIQPVDLIGVDAAIIFSDILVVPEAIGLPYDIAKGEGPVFHEVVRTMSDLKKLHKVGEKSNLDHTIEAIRLAKKELDGRVPLIGFAGAPWTLFCYMTEGGGSKSFSTPRGLLYSDEVFSRTLLEQLTEATITYLKAQIKAGADIVQVFDSWAGLLNRDMFEQFSLPYISEICKAITEVPVIVFAKGAFHSLDLIGGLDCNVVGIDWTVEADVVEYMIPDKTLQGNLDPAALYGSPERVQDEVLRMLSRFPPMRHIVNLGHGIYPDLPRENVKLMVDTVKSFRYLNATNN